MGILHALCVFIVGATLFCVSNACETCNGAWRKVYEHDGHGVPVTGSKAELLAANQRGAKLRVMFPHIGEQGHVEEVSRSFNFMGYVCGYAGLNINKDRWDHFLDDGQWRSLMFCNSGLYLVLLHEIGSQVKIFHTSFQVGIVWFVHEQTCPSSIYSFLANDDSVSGSKDELKHAILSGFDVTFVLHGRAYYHCDNIEISESTGDIFAQYLWSAEGSQDFSIWVYGVASSTGSKNLVILKKEDGVIQKHLHTNKIDMEWLIDSCWRHVFTNDENGFEQDGSLTQLIAAVEQGHRVKIVMGKYSIEADNVRVKLGQVSANLLSQISMNKSYNFLDDNYWIWQMVHTTGTVRTRRYSIGNGTNRGDTVEKKAISWFVDTRPWTKILSTEKYGQVTSGSKADLKNAIENGASVRVGLQFGQSGRHGHHKEPNEWFIIKTENVEISSSGELAAGLIRSVSTEEVAPGEFQITDDPFWKFMLVTTESNVDILQWRVGAHINDGHFSEKATVNWFVNV